MEKYSAGINKNSFWLNEFVAVAQMRSNGDDWQDVKGKIVEDNVLIISSTQRAKQMYGVLHRRLSSLSKPLIEQLQSADLESQKILNLVGIMNTELLVKQYVLNKFRDELILGDGVIEPYELQAFFDQLQATHSDVADWTDQTIHRLIGTIKNYLKMAGLAVSDGERLIVQRPILSYQLETTLKAEGYGAYVSALTGM